MSSTPKLRPLRDFAMLSEDWYEDDVLHAIAEETTPMVFAYIPMLIGRCRRRSHIDDNPDGWVKLTIKQAAKMICDEPGMGEAADVWLGARMAMWASLHDGEIVEIDGEIAGRFRTRLLNFRKYQTPRGSSTERTRDWRSRAGENPPQGTHGEHSGNDAEQSVAHIDRDRDRDRDIDIEKNPPSCVRASEAAAPHDDDDQLAPLPKTHQRDIGAQITRARGQLGSLTMSVETIISTARSDRDRDYTDAELVRQFWRPACELLAEVGTSRMRAALGTAISNGAASIAYAATVARSDHRKSDVRSKAEKAANSGIPDIGTRMSEDELRAQGLLPPVDGVAS